jgi:hypothetical protein
VRETQLIKRLAQNEQVETKIIPSFKSFKKTMAINGLRKNKATSMWSATVSKGMRKEKNVGRDLNSELLRVTPCNATVANIIKTHYKVEPDQNGDFLLSHLNIFCSTNFIETTFECSMKLWSASRLEQVCDRTCISKKVEEYVDMFGNPRTRMKTVSEPCAIADQELGVQCPRGCTQEGVLTFYIAELVYNGIGQCAKMTLKAWTDLEGVNAQLEEIEQTYGNIKLADFPTGCNMIPLVLGRSQVKIKRPVIQMENGKPVYAEGTRVARRTGKKAEAIHWAISISVRPDFALKFSAFQTMVLQKQLGYQPSMNLLKQAGLEIPSNSYAQLPPSRLTNEEIALLIRQNGWTGDSMRLMLKEEFGVTEISGIPDCDYQRFVEILESSQESQKWTF